MTMKLHKLMPVIGLLFIATVTQAQVFYNNGATVYMNTGAIVQINGDASNNGVTGYIDNLGDVTITGSLTNNNTAGGDGDFHVAGDWINNSTFNAGTGSVELNGTAQQITGTQTTGFYDLLLTGTGIKSLKIDAHASNLLALNDRELSTEAHTMIVDNAATNAITRTSGFVSSATGGSLARATSTTGTYEFPTGSSVGTVRYRPVNITPNFPFANMYNVRFANYDATTDAFDRANIDSTICTTNPNWFHMINRTSGTTSADVAINFDVTDGSWERAANWVNPSSQWQSMGAATVLANYVTTSTWNNFSNEPYILTTTKANAQITVVAPMCENNAALNLTAAETGGVWAGTGITDVNAGTFNPLTAGPGTHTITYTISGACGDAGQIQVTINEVAQLSALTTDETCINAVNGKIDLTVTGGTAPYAYLWDNSETTEDLDPLAPGTYTIIVSDANNCSTTETYNVLAGTSECVPESFYIPNIFSPNGDHSNDVLFVRGTGIKTLHLVIYDRWGEKVFETENPAYGWDGKYQTQDLESAVFVYQVHAEMNSGTVYDEKGSITLVR